MRFVRTIKMKLITPYNPRWFTIYNALMGTK